MTVEIVYGLAPGEAVEAPPPEGDSSYVHKANHQSEAEDYLLSQFERSPQLHAWVRALVKPFQSLEDMFNVLRTAFDPYTAVGDQLTKIGNILGEPRGNRSDAELRAYVLARIAVNNSDGSAADIYKVARIILGEEWPQLRLERVPPAKYILHATGQRMAYPWDAATPPLTVAVSLADLVTQATSGGVGMILHYGGGDEAHTFRFAPADVGVADPNRGFANDAATTGGKLTDYAVGG